jgi:glucose-6-phosphate isomerase
MPIHESPAWGPLQKHARDMGTRHLRDLLADRERSLSMIVEHDGITLDYSRQNATRETMTLLRDLAEQAGVAAKLARMAGGEHINRTEDRAVMHVALRAERGDAYAVDGRDVVADVLTVRAQIDSFAAEVRDGRHKGVTGEGLRNVIAIGIGGSYLGADFVSEALRTDPACAKAARGRTLRFLANVDPIDVARATEGLDPAETLVVVISKTFTTAETMLNARALREWLVRALGAGAVRRHMVAVSTNLRAVEAFGIDPANAFAFWDWVGGRYSVCSAVGLLPLALHYGFPPLARFLQGARAIDRHVLTAPFEQNLPMLLGLLGVWNSTFLGRPVRALLPYCQALHRFAPHIQQVDMESNGKRVTIAGEVLPFEAGEVDFGEPGTNGQHSFYQLLHQGRVVPADFIGFRRSQQPMQVEGQALASHDELMANFFAQPDALALGKTADELRSEGEKEALVPHREFPGNRPSNVLLLDALDPYTTGQLLALYEHRTAVQGFVWDVNSFDQWGVQLGKVLATRIGEHLKRARAGQDAAVEAPASTQELLRRYL